MHNLEYHRGRCLASNEIAICFQSSGSHMAFLSCSQSIAIYCSSLSTLPVFADGDSALTCMGSTDAQIVVGDLEGSCYGFSWSGARQWKIAILPRNERVLCLSPLVPLYGGDACFFAASSQNISFHSTKSQRTIPHIVAPRLQGDICAVDASSRGCLAGTSEGVFVLDATGDVAMLRTPNVSTLCDVPFGFVVGTHSGEIFFVVDSGLTKTVPRAHDGSVSVIKSGNDGVSQKALSLGADGMLVVWDVVDGVKRWSIGGGDSVHHLVAATVSQNRKILLAASSDGAVGLYRWDKSLVRLIRTSPISRGVVLFASNELVCLGRCGGICRLWRIDVAPEKVNFASTERHDSPSPVRITRHLVDSKIVVDVSPNKPKRGRCSPPKHQPFCNLTQCLYSTELSSVSSTSAFETSIFQCAVVRYLCASLKPCGLSNLSAIVCDEERAMSTFLKVCSDAGRNLPVGASEDTIDSDAQRFALSVGEDSLLVRSAMCVSLAHELIVADTLSLPTFRGVAFRWCCNDTLEPPCTNSVILFPTVVIATSNLSQALNDFTDINGSGGTFVVIQSSSAKLVDLSSTSGGGPDSVVFSPFTTFRAGDPFDAAEVVPLSFRAQRSKMKFWMLYEYHVAC